MESYLNENFDMKAKHSSGEALQKWRKLCGVVRNPKRRFRFTANLSKRHEAAVVRRMQQEKLRIAVLVSKAAFQFVHGFDEREYIVPEEVATAGFEICASELESIVGSRNVKKLKIHGGVEGIAKKVRSSTEDGLTVTNGLENRETIYGSNKILDGETSSFWRFAWEALQDLTLIIDAICAFISLVVGIATEGWDNRAHDALVIVASISLVVFVTATNDYWQSVKFRNWEIEKKKTLVRVTRDGFRQKLLSYELLPGDVVHLTTGDQVPSDGVFVSGFPVLVDESSVTGDSEPIKVDTENPFLLSGSKVLDGSCKMMVTTVGMRTSWGKLVAADDKRGYDETPFQVKLNGLVEIIGRIGKYLALVTFSVLMKGLLTHKLQEETIWRWSGYDALEMFKYFTISFTIFGITVPEGLPLALTLNLAFSMNNMVKDNALFRHMAACETLGTATNICTDKTGIITSNQMSVLKLCFCMNVKDVSRHNNASSLCSEIPDTALRLLVQSIFVNKDSEVVNKDGKLEIWGTPTETALLEFGLSLDGNFQEQGGKLKLVKVEHFKSAKKKMQVVAELPDGGFRAYCKGAPEIVLALCDKVINANGNVVPLDEAFIAYLKSAVNQFAGEGLRTLCLAYTELEDGFWTSDPIPSFGYTCIAILGIKDSFRLGIKDSVAACHAAGITVRMVTGDSIDTAKAIARECGILTEDGIAIEGADFREKNLEELLELIPKIQVIARSSPLDKHSLVKHLQTTFNEVVAVTGAGADDAPSLYEADIGLATTIHGTEVAKASADVIILDDDFSTIVKGAKWGRLIVMNIKKFIQFQLTVNVVALILNISSAWLTGSVPFSDVELLWVSLITETLGAFALAAEAPDDNLMTNPPDGRKGSVISSVMYRNIFGQFLYQFTIIWFLQAKGKEILRIDDPDSNLILDTFIFNTFIFCQVSNLISCRKLNEKNAFRGILCNYVFIAVLGLIVLFQITIIEFLDTLANTSPLTMWQWFLSIFIGLVGILVAAGVKMIPV